MLDKINKLKEQKLVRTQRHPRLPLTIVNYSNHCVYADAWDDLTLKCRGLVIDDEGNAVNNPMNKFFNFQEQRGKYDCSFKKPYKTYKKLDGSLIQVFIYKGEAVVTSRGSFDSEHAKQAWSILMDNSRKWKFTEGLTYCFELLHPDLRIVIDYGQEPQLKLLAVRDKNGDLPLDSPMFDAFDRVEEIQLDIKQYKDLKEIPEVLGEEGYVVLFEDGKRVKIKFKTYCEQHRVITNCSSYDVWNSMKDGKDLSEMAEICPDEWLQWYYKTIGEIYTEYTRITNQIEKEWEDKCYSGEGNRPRKEWADIITKCKNPAELFLKLDGKSYSDNVWQRCKPDLTKAFSI